MYEYFYGAQADQFSFYRVPSVFFTEKKYSGMSTDAKVLYAILLRRMELSAKNDWIDREGRVFIVFPIDEIKEMMGCGKNKAIQLLDELEEKVGIIERKRQGQGKPSIIYVKNFIEKDAEEANFQKFKNQTSRSLEMKLLEVSKSNPSYKDKSDKEKRESNLILSGEEKNRRDIRNQQEKDLWEALEMDVLLFDYPNERELLNSIFTLLVEVFASTKPVIQVAGESKPADTVKERLLQLNCFHIRYVLLCLKEKTGKVRNIKQYLLAMLYNAPVTMEAYYEAKLNEK